MHKADTKNKTGIQIVLFILGRSIYIIFTSLIIILAGGGRLSWIGLGIFASGIILQAIAMWQLRGFYTVRLGIQPEHRLVTTGVYRLLRHPGYLSYIISIFGIGLSLGSLFTLVFAVFIVLFIRWRIKGEEEMLLTEFGDEYRIYMKKTKRLIPFIY